MYTLTMELWAPPSLSHTMNEPCMNDECNVNSENECMRPQNQIWCGTPMESTCKATTNVFHDQRCAYLSHFQFNSSSTGAPPASSDSWSPMHSGVALPKQMRP